MAVPLAAQAQMPTDAQLQAAVQEAYEKFKDVKDGANANYIPELDKVPSDLWGVAIVTAQRRTCSPRATWTTRSRSSRCPSPSPRRW